VSSSGGVVGKGGSASCSSPQDCVQHQLQGRAVVGAEWAGVIIGMQREAWGGGNVPLGPGNPAESHCGELGYKP